MKQLKVALLGSGKTGSKVVDLCKQEKYKNIELEVFNSSNPLSQDRIGEFNIVLSFLTGEVFRDSYFDLLCQSGIYVVTGSTGFEWTQELLDKVNASEAVWIKSTNFSLGMNLAKEMIRIAARANTLFDDGVTYSINEVHHTKKVDAPSGTAVSWKQWLGRECDITSERTGDVVGVHELTLDTPNEVINIKHEAKDRSVFAAGALWACEKALELEPGLHDFSEVALQVIKN